MKTAKLYMVIFLSLISGYVFSQEKAYLPYFEVINMRTDYSKSATKLFKLYVEQGNKYQVILPERFDSLNLSQSPDNVKKEASKQNAPYFFIGEINKLGDKAIVVITLYKTQDGSKVWTGTQKALEPDDLDPVLNKFAAGINGNITVDKSEDIYNVTNNEKEELNKVTSNTYFGFEIGGAATFFSDVDNNFPAGFGLMLSKDVRDVIVDLKGEFYFGDVNLYGVIIDVNLPLYSGKNSPFLSGGIGYTGATLSHQNPDPYYYEKINYSGGGLSLYAGGGYLMNRTADVNIRIQPSFFYSAYKVNGKRPVGVELNIALLF